MCECVSECVAIVMAVVTAEKVNTLEAEAESTAALAAPSSLEARFQSLEGGNVEDELQALKRGKWGASWLHCPVLVRPTYVWLKGRVWCSAVHHRQGCVIDVPRGIGTAIEQ